MNIWGELTHVFMHESMLEYLNYDLLIEWHVRRSNIFRHQFRPILARSFPASAKAYPQYHLSINKHHIDKETENVEDYSINMCFMSSQVQYFLPDRI